MHHWCRSFGHSVTALQWSLYAALSEISVHTYYTWWTISRVLCKSCTYITRVCITLEYSIVSWWTNYEKVNMWFDFWCQAIKKIAINGIVHNSPAIIKTLDLTHHIQHKLQSTEPGISTINLCTKSIDLLSCTL